MKKIIVFQCIVFLLMIGGSAFADVLVITNKAVSEKGLSKEDLKGVFLGKKKKWKDKSKIHFVTLKDPDVHQTFLKAYVKKSEKQYANYWRKMVFTGKGKIPKSFETTEELMEYVANTPGAIGYIDKNTTAVNVKTIDIQ